LKSPHLTPRTLAALLMLLTVAAYVPAMSAGYIWDDDTLLTANPQMRSADGLAQIWRGEQTRDYQPVTLSVFWLEWRLWGDNPAGYHAVNILLHGLGAVLLWLVLARLRVPGAWLGALLFAVHPVNVASVAWVAELKNTLSGVLFFGSVLSFLAARDGERKWGAYFAALGLFVLAALSKGAVVTLPAVLLICEAWEDRRVTWRELVRIVPFAVIAGVMAFVTIRFQARAPHYGLVPDTIAYRIPRAGMATWYYIGGLFWPVGMSPMRGPWVAELGSAVAWLPAAGVVGVIAILYWKRRSWGRGVLFGYGYFLVMLLPVLGFVWMTLMQETPSADWWQYLAAPGIFACIGAGVAMASRRWRVVTPIFCAVVAMLMMQTWLRAGIYHSMESYCRAVTEEDQHAWTLQNNLGIMLKREGRYAESEACYRQALRDNPGYIEAHINLGNTLAAAGNAKGAEGEYRTAAQMRPDDPQSLQPLADLLAAEGRKDEALSVQVAAVKAGPRSVEGLYKLGEMLEGRGRYADAAGCFGDAAGLAAGSIPIRIELCRALLAEGKRDAALQVSAEVDRLAQASGDADAISAAAELRNQCDAAGRP
jgi:protein O-mannosyl-transferase